MTTIGGSTTRDTTRDPDRPFKWNSITKPFSPDLGEGRTGPPRPVDEDEKHGVILPDTAEICAFRYESPAFRIFGTHRLRPEGK